MILLHLLKPELEELIAQGQWQTLRSFLSTQPAPEIAELLEHLDQRGQLVIFRLLPRALASEVFALLTPDTQNLLVSRLAQEEMRSILAGLSPDDRTALFEELPAEVTQRLLALLPDDKRREALVLLSYPEYSVGRLMTTAYLQIKPTWNVARVLAHIRAHGADSETIMILYVTDEQGHLLDDVPLRKVLLAAPETPVSVLMDGQYACLRSLQDQEEAVALFKQTGYYALPVVDADNVLLGIVTVDDILDVVEQETTEDFQKLGKVRPIEASLRDVSLFELYRKRIGWLVGLVFVNIFTGAGMAIFEETIRKVIALVFFLPLLIGSGGNAGSQTTTLMVRALAIGDARRTTWWRIIRREVIVSLILGLCMAAAVALLALLRGGVDVAVVVSAAMCGVIFFGSMTGVLLPLILRGLGFDPAAAGAPLVTSLVDIAGVLIYFSIAYLWFDRLMTAVR
ncbi:MAG: magnesium transporter [bacterium]|nr:magnesium transporter [bacterium]